MNTAKKSSWGGPLDPLQTKQNTEKKNHYQNIQATK